MSGISEVYLWLVIDKNIRNNSGNLHIVVIDQIMMSPIELLKCCYQFGFFWYLWLNNFVVSTFTRSVKSWYFEQALALAINCDT